MNILVAPWRLTVSISPFWKNYTFIKLCNRKSLSIEKPDFFWKLSKDLAMLWIYQSLHISKGLSAKIPDLDFPLFYIYQAVYFIIYVICFFLWNKSQPELGNVKLHLLSFAFLGKPSRYTSKLVYLINSQIFKTQTLDMDFTKGKREQTRCQVLLL